MRPPASSPSGVQDPPRVTRTRAVAVTVSLALLAAGLVALAVVRPLWLLALPAAVLVATVAGGLLLFARARRVARRRRAALREDAP